MLSDCSLVLLPTRNCSRKLNAVKEMADPHTSRNAFRTQDWDPHLVEATYSAPAPGLPGPVTLLPGLRMQVAGKRWRVDLGSRGEASLLLSAVNLPGGVQRRRTAEDELSMRSIFQEGDVISVSSRAGAGCLAGWHGARLC